MPKNVRSGPSDNQNNEQAAAQAVKARRLPTDPAQFTEEAALRSQPKQPTFARHACAGNNNRP